MMDNLITEIGFVLLGGIVAAIPVYLLGLALKQNEWITRWLQRNASKYGRRFKWWVTLFLNARS